MRKEEFVFVSGEEKPQIMFTPKVYAIVRDFSTFFTVDNGREITVVYKVEEKKKGRRKR